MIFYEIEGLGVDRIVATDGTSVRAAQVVMQDAHVPGIPAELTWLDAGSDAGTLAVYQIPDESGRVTVRRVSGVLLDYLLDDEETDVGYEVVYEAAALRADAQRWDEAGRPTRSLSV